MPNRATWSVVDACVKSYGKLPFLVCEPCTEQKKRWAWQCSHLSGGSPEFGHVTGITCNGPFKTAWSKTMVGYDLEVSSLSVAGNGVSGMWA